MENIPHEKSYRLRVLEKRLDEANSELEWAERWAYDSSVRLDIRLGVRFLLLPLCKASSCLSSFLHKFESYIDRCEGEEYLKDVLRD